MKEIKLINQPTTNTCASACIAMLADMSINQVLNEFHNKYTSHQITLQGYLLSKGVQITTPMFKPSFPAPLTQGRVYILTVPSLNEQGMFHSIVVDTREGPAKIYDPCEGLVGMKFYQNSLSDLLAVPLRSWIIEAYIPANLLHVMRSGIEEQT